MGPGGPEETWRGIICRREMQTRGLQESRSGLRLVEKLQVDLIEETDKGDVRCPPLRGREHSVTSEEFESVPFAL